MKNLSSNIKNVIIFGASSFLGTNLRNAFLSEGFNVYSIYRSSSTDRKILNDSEYHIHFNGKIKSLSKLSSLSNKRTLIINCCGYTGLPNEVDNLSLIIEANLEVTSKIIQFMNAFHFDKLIITESYWQFDENGFECGNTIYAECKNMQSTLVRYFCKKYSMKIIGLVLYDIYGESDERPKLLNELAKCISLNKSIDLTSGDQLIDFVHVSDVVNAYKAIAFSLFENNCSLYDKFTRYYVRSNEPLTNLKEKLTNCLNTLGYKSKINWSKKIHPPYQIFKPYWPLKKQYCVPNWSCKVTFSEGFSKVIKKYDR